MAKFICFVKDPSLLNEPDTLSDEEKEFFKGPKLEDMKRKFIRIAIEEQ